MRDEPAGGRLFFSSVRRSLEVEDEVVLASVGVDIGSSTSHLVFSRLVLERLDNRYIVSERRILHESEVLLTPFVGDGNTGAIDAGALGRFIDHQYKVAMIDPQKIDTGALILTGVAVRRHNARAIGELFADQAGKFVSVSAGDALETRLAAFGSGAAARSIRESVRVMNVDIGGGTSKIALCEAGEVTGLTAIDIGARIVSFDDDGRVNRIEEAARRFASEAGLTLEIGEVPDAAGLQRMVSCMADRLFEAMSQAVPSAGTAGLLRMDPLDVDRPPDVVIFSGGVSEYIYGHQSQPFGDLGPAFAAAVLERASCWGPCIEPPDQGIRATVVGASQYTVQVSGSTIFVTPQSVLPIRNVPTIVPALPLADESLDAEGIAEAIRASLRGMDLHEGQHAVALCYHWQGSATYARLQAFCHGVERGLSALLARGLPLILVGDGDVGGLVGIHLHEESGITNAIVSIDGITLSELDFVDIGALLEASGAVPLVIKSLVFPTSAALGRSGA